MAEEEEVEAEEAFELQPLLDLATGDFAFEFEFSALPLASGEVTEVVPVAYIDTKLLVVVPSSVWHRQTARRVLPPHALTKVVNVEVQQCSQVDRTVVAEGKTRVWMGFLQEGLAAQLVSADAVEALDYQFLCGDLPGYLPFAKSLVDVAQDHFSFLSAAEDHTTGAGGGSGSAELSMDSRMQRLEAAVESMSSVISDMATTMNPKRVTFSPTVERPSALRQNRAQASQLEKYPDLDAAVVTSAISAGVPEDALQEMQRLMGMNVGRAKKLSEPPMSPSPKKVPKKNVLSETESEAEDAEDVGLELGDSEPSVAKSLQQLTKIVSALTAERVRKSRVSKVEAALDGISASSVGDGGSLGSGKKAAAARRVLRTSLVESPEEIYALVEKYMAEDLRLQTQTPGVPVPQLCARAWIEHRSRIGNYKTSAYCAWSAGGILDSLISGNVPQARARAALLILMLDQTAVDRGSWTLSSELALEPPPPMSALAQHQPPLLSEGEVPFSRLLDPRWAEVSLAHLREAEDYLSRRTKLGKKGQEEDVAPKLKAKAKAKGAAAASSGSTE